VEGQNVQVTPGWLPVTTHTGHYSHTLLQRSIFVQVQETLTGRSVLFLMWAILSVRVVLFLSPARSARAGRRSVRVPVLHSREGGA
jgi:hypothetical protein